MLIQDFVSRLEHVHGEGPYKARCPAHEDSTPSLSITEGEGGRILLKCHATCTTEEVVGALGLTMADLMPEGEPRRESAAPQIVKTYDYTDEHGKLLYQAVRMYPKAFRQRRPDGAGGWDWSMSGVRRVPYRLHHLIKAVGDGAKTVFVVEGEKDADKLWSLGFPATTNAAGAGKWGDGETQALAFLPADVRVVVLPDNDLPGAKHAAEVCFYLKGICRDAQPLELPGLPPKGDVSDWFSDGHTADELAALCDVQRVVVDAATVVDHKPEERFHLTDLGNAKRLVARHGNDLRYVHAWGSWLVWDGKRWQRDTTGEINRRAKDTALSIYHEAAQEDDGDRRKAVADHAKRTEAEARIKAMVSLAQSEVGVAVGVDDLDADTMLLNVSNGIIDLRSGKLLPHDRAKLMTKLVNVAYAKDAPAPIWTGFLNRIMGGNADLVAFLQRAVGYSLTGSTAEQVMFFLYGTGANGKSTFQETIRQLWGDYAQQADPETFMARSGEGARNDIARLVGARFVSASEVEDGRRLSESVVKQLTGADRITARFLYREHFEFNPQFKLFMAGNHKPTIRGTDLGIWRRIRLIPFEVTIPAAERDGKLMDKLRMEAAGVLAWAVQGCLDWQWSGLGVPDVVQEATDSYREEMDVMGEFLRERCRIGKPNAVVASELFKVWKEWCDDAGEFAGTKKGFAMKLKDRGFQADKGAGNRALYRGLALEVG